MKKIYQDGEITNGFDVGKYGVIIAIRIYYGGDDSITPIAELKSAFGYRFTMQWTDYTRRSIVAPYINGYTFIYDERERVSFDEM